MSKSTLDFFVVFFFLLVEFSEVFTDSLKPFFTVCKNTCSVSFYYSSFKDLVSELFYNLSFYVKLISQSKDKDEACRQSSI